MGLQPRDTLVEIFSTFLNIRDNRKWLYDGWIFDPPLKNSMECRIQEDPEGNEDYWALFWLKQVLENPKHSLARGHLSAYLEEVCHGIIVKDKNFKYILEIYNISKEDGFQIVRAIAAQPEILKQYQPGYSQLKTYGRIRISEKAKEEIRQGREEERFSKAGRLRYITRKRLKESLKQAGLQGLEFDKLLLAWQCFKEIYTVTATQRCQTLPWPPPEKLAEIAEYYNQRRTPSMKEIKRESLNTMLEECYQIIRDYSSIKLVYFDKDFGELPADDISYRSVPLEPSYFQAEKQQEVNSVLLKAFEKLKSEDRKILQLSLGLNLTQLQISKILKIAQSQVSRKRNSSKITLLPYLAKWSEKKFKIKLNSEKLNQMLPEIEEWLEQHCINSCNECLKNTLIQSFPSDLQILTQLYSNNLKQKFVAEGLKISEVELKEKVDKMKEHLQHQLMVNVEKRLKVSLKPCPSARQKIAAFVETWLENAPYATFK